MGSWVPRSYALRRTPRFIQFSLQIGSLTNPKYAILWRPQLSTFSPRIEAVGNCAPYFSSSSRSEELVTAIKGTKKTLQGVQNARQISHCMKTDEGSNIELNENTAAISLFEDIQPIIKGSRKKNPTRIVETVDDRFNDPSSPLLQTVKPVAKKVSPVKDSRNHAQSIERSEKAQDSARKASRSKNSSNDVEDIAGSEDVSKVVSMTLLPTSEPKVRKTARKAPCLISSANNVQRISSSEDVCGVPSSSSHKRSQPARKGTRKTAQSKSSIDDTQGIRISDDASNVSGLSMLQSPKPGRGGASNTSRLKAFIDVDPQKMISDSSTGPNPPLHQGETTSKVEKKKSSKKVLSKDVKGFENSVSSMQSASKDGEKSLCYTTEGFEHQDLSGTLHDGYKISSLQEQSTATAIMHNPSQNAQLDRIDTRNPTNVKVCKDALTVFHKINEDETNSIKLPLLEARPDTGTAKKERNIENLSEEMAGLMPTTLEVNDGAGIKSIMETHVVASDSSCMDNNESRQTSHLKQNICDVKREPCDTKYIDNIKISKRSKKNPEEIASLLRLHTCSKYGDLHGALELYDSLKAEGIIKLNLNYYSSLLYICSGAASGTLTIAKSGKDKRPETIRRQDDNGSAHPSNVRSSSEDINEVINFSSADKELAMKRGMEIYEDMLKLHVPLCEAIFTSLCRLAVAKGDGDLAFDIVKQMSSQGITPKLRSYGPALLCFCKNNEIQKAFEVDRHMAEAGVLPDETTLDNLLKVSISAAHEDRVYSLLHRLRKCVRDLAPSTVRSIEKWFNSNSAASAGGSNFSLEDISQAIEANGGGWHGLGWLGEGKWEVKRTNISKTGSCLSCGEKLCTIDLDPKETALFADSIAGFACEREHYSNQFEEFQEWLDKNGPYGAILDGANIGLYNPQVFRGFCFKLLANVMRKTSTTISSQRPLILLHNRHSTRIAKTPSDEAILNRWKKEKLLYFTPQGSNDDWYWLYAAVKCRCLLVTNDEMRDHIFELLGTDFFPKWKERHQVRFSYSPKGLELHMPPPYSIVIQESQHGSWHVPQAGGDDIDVPREWLCITRPINNVSNVLHTSHS